MAGVGTASSKLSGRRLLRGAGTSCSGSGSGSEDDETEEELFHLTESEAAVVRAWYRVAARRRGSAARLLRAAANARTAAAIFIWRRSCRGAPIPPQLVQRPPKVACHPVIHRHIARR
jgi:hypothetical protein